MSQLSPIILFVYNRPEHTRKTIEALVKNDLASESMLYVFADGPKYNATPEQIASVEAVREYIHSITGFKEVIIEEAQKNKGLANSVIAGVTKVINEWGKVIVVEDDIVTHPFFLRYMNDCLDVYKERKNIYMIGGYNCNIKFPRTYRKDVYVVHRACSWGWATWKECWDKADWMVKDYNLLLEDKKMQKTFNLGGNDMFPMLQDQMNGKIDSWAIRWDYSMSRNGALCIRPTKSLCCNCGFDGTGVHCGEMRDDYMAPMYSDLSYFFKLNPDVQVVKSIEKEFAFFQQTGGEHLPSKYNILRAQLRRVYRRCRHRLARLLHRKHFPTERY